MGYTFEGWYADSKFNTKVTGPEGETYYTASLSGNLTLYAKWRTHKYTLIYDMNKPENTEVKTEAKVEPVELSYDKSIKVAANKWALYKYIFTGWNTERDGSGRAYKVGATVKNLTAKDKGECILYAQWTPSSYTVKYDGNGSSVGLSAKGKVANTTMKFYSSANTTAANNYVISGYTFVGWNTRADGKGKTFGDVPAEEGAVVNGVQTIGGGLEEAYAKDTNAVVTLYAQWKPIPYKVKIFSNADAGQEDPTEFTLNIGQALSTEPQSRLARNGYKLDSFNTMANGKGKKYALNAKNMAAPGAEITLYAQWGKPLSYKSTYKNCSAADGVKNSNAVSYTYNAKKTVSVKKPTRAGYLFKGWTAPYGKEYFDQAKNCIKAGTAENVVLTANWVPITYEVKLNLNSKDKGISLKTDADTVYGSRDGNGIEYNSDDASFDVQDIVNIPVYYELTGWNTRNNGKGIEAECVIDEETGEITSVKLAGLCTKDKGTVTLYAIWKPKSYSITYLNVDPDNKNAEDIVELTGVKVSNPVTYTYNASKAVSLKNPTKYGFVFEGWYTGYDAGTGKYTNKITSISKGSYGNITLYGKWRVK